MRKFLIGYLSIVASTLPAAATFHLWNDDEIFSTADGLVQFIEFTTLSAGQDLLSNQVLRAVSADGSQTNDFVFPNNLPSSVTAGKTFLVATPGFDKLPGGVTPDYEIPRCFIFLEGSIDLVGAAATQSLGAAELPTDGISSYDTLGLTTNVNSPKNFNGDAGSVDIPVAGSERVFLEGLYHNNTNLDPQVETIPHAAFQTNTFLEANYDQTNVCVYFLTSSPAGDEPVVTKVRFFPFGDFGFVEEFVDATFQANVFLEQTNQFHGSPTKAVTNKLDLWKATWEPPRGFTGTVFYAPQVLAANGNDSLFLTRKIDTNNLAASGANDFYWSTDGQSFGPSAFDVDYSFVWTNPTPPNFDYVYHNNPGAGAPSAEAVPGLGGPTFLQYNYESNKASAVYMLAPPFSVSSVQTRFYFVNGGGEIYRTAQFVSNIVIDSSSPFHGLPTSGAVTLSVWCTEFWPPAGWQSNSFYYANQITSPTEGTIWLIEDFDGAPGGLSVTNNWTANPQLFNTEFPISRDWGVAPTGAIQRASVSCDFAYHNHTNLNPQTELIPDSSGETFLQVDYTTTTTVFRVLTDSPFNVVPGENVTLELRTVWSTNGFATFSEDYNAMAFNRNVFIDETDPFHGLPVAGTNQLDLWTYNWPQPTQGGQPITNSFAVFYSFLLKTTFGEDNFQTGYKYLIANSAVGTANNYPIDPQYSGNDPVNNDYSYINQFTLDLDSDGDGLTDAQELALGTNPFNPDSDGDTQTDGEEFFAGLSPTNGLAFFHVVDTTPTDGITIEWFAVTGRTYDVECATGGVVNGQAFITAITGVTVNADQNISTNLPLADGQRTYRIRVR